VGVGCLAFGLLRAFALQLQVLWVGVPYQIVLALPYAVTLLLLAMTGRRTRSPSALAQPF
jgi:ABC-type uncharacterized transport system permease subunit